MEWKAKITLVLRNKKIKAYTLKIFLVYTIIQEYICIFLANPLFHTLVFCVQCTSSTYFDRSKKKQTTTSSEVKLLNKCWELRRKMDLYHFDFGKTYFLQFHKITVYENLKYWYNMYCCLPNNWISNFRKWRL